MTLSGQIHRRGEAARDTTRHGTCTCFAIAVWLIMPIVVITTSALRPCAATS